MSIDIVIKFLVVKNIKYKENVSLSEYSYFRAGGNVKLIVMPTTSEGLTDVIKFLNNIGCPFKVVGATSNLLFLNGESYSIIISTRGLNDLNIKHDQRLATVSAGLMIPKFSKKLSSLGYTGFEGLLGIPGTIGGAIYWNAGAFGHSMSDLLISVKIMEPDGLIKLLDRNEIDFSFRKSPFQNTGRYIIEASFLLNTADQNYIDNKLKEHLYNRLRFQEKTLPNLGSVFSTFDIYKEISRNNSIYSCLLFFIRVLYKLTRSDNNKLLNKITCLYFGWKFKTQPYSVKTLNCIVNRGQDTKEILDNVYTLRKIISSDVKIENEVYVERNV
mgnify:CR=1 FL=1